MGRVVTFDQLPGEVIADGIMRAPITRGDTTEMAADFIRIAPGKRWASAVPRGSDCYLFMLDGRATIVAAGKQQSFPAQTFATVQEGVEFSLLNDGGSPADVVQVVAPPQPSARPLAGFSEGISVAQRTSLPVVDLPDEKKSTFTGLHHHPNAESMFVVLDGALEFTVNGAPALVRPGQAAYFGINDRHGLHTADGHSGASFLEFHIPGAFTTVKSPALAG
jgi:mannose-6-phosphate isomerase-like protein (cupin superfamily)